MQFLMFVFDLQWPTVTSYNNAHWLPPQELYLPSPLVVGDFAFYRKSFNCIISRQLKPHIMDFCKLYYISNISIMDSCRWEGETSFPGYRKSLVWIMLVHTHACMCVLTYTHTNKISKESWSIFGDALNFECYYLYQSLADQNNYLQGMLMRSSHETLFILLGCLFAQ